MSIDKQASDEDSPLPTTHVVLEGTFPSWASILLTQILGERYSDFRLIRGAPFGAFCVAGVGDFHHASILPTQILGARYSDFG